MLLEQCGIFNNLAVVAYSEKDYEQASAWYEQSLELARELGSLSDERNTFENLSLLSRDLGNLSQAVKYARQAQRLSYQLGDRQRVVAMTWRIIRFRIHQAILRLKSYAR